MKYTWHFVTGDSVTLEVDEATGRLLRRADRQERRSERRENRPLRRLKRKGARHGQTADRG